LPSGNVRTASPGVKEKRCLPVEKKKRGGGKRKRGKRKHEEPHLAYTEKPGTPSAPKPRWWTYEKEGKGKRKVDAKRVGPAIALSPLLGLILIFCRA